MAARASNVLVAGSGQLDPYAATRQFDNHMLRVVAALVLLNDVIDEAHSPA